MINNRLEIVKLLIENKAEVNVPDSYSHTPIYFADLWKHIDIKTYLAEHGADKFVIPKKSQ